jgi:hypothetical protein
VYHPLELRYSLTSWDRAATNETRVFIRNHSIFKSEKSTINHVGATNYSFIAKHWQRNQSNAIRSHCSSNDNTNEGYAKDTCHFVEKCMDPVVFIQSCVATPPHCQFFRDERSDIIQCVARIPSALQVSGKTCLLSYQARFCCKYSRVH